MASSRAVSDALRVTPGSRKFPSPSSTPKANKKRARAEHDADADLLRHLQERLYAEGKRSLLIVLQGMDTSGKDGTIKHVIGAVDPQGARITSFKQPTPEERRHDFLWRIAKALPSPGELGIFNRSHYEDVLVVRVHELVPESVWSKRYAIINRFEKDLAKRGTKIVKFFLHISYEEQRVRLARRLKDPTKRWKFNPKDLDERARWNDYQAAYADAVARCSTAEAPWFVIPADKEWYRDWAVSKILIETLEDMDPRYPKTNLDVPALLKRLAAE